MERLEARGVRVVLCGVRGDLHDVMTRVGMIDRIGAEHVFREARVRQTSTMLAVAHAYRLMGDRCSQCHWRGVQDMTLLARSD